MLSFFHVEHLNGGFSRALSRVGEFLLWFCVTVFFVVVMVVMVVMVVISCMTAVRFYPFVMVVVVVVMVIVGHFSESGGFEGALRQ